VIPALNPPFKVKSSFFFVNLAPFRSFGAEEKQTKGESLASLNGQNIQRGATSLAD
jgi:hypothetical protein